MSVSLAWMFEACKTLMGPQENNMHNDSESRLNRNMNVVLDYDLWHYYNIIMKQCSWTSYVLEDWVRRREGSEWHHVVNI